MTNNFTASQARDLAVQNKATHDRYMTDFMPGVYDLLMDKARHGHRFARILVNPDLLCSVQQRLIDDGYDVQPDRNDAINVRW